MLAFGLSTGKFKKDEYDTYQLAQANKLANIKIEITEKIQAANPELTEAQVAEKVALYTFEHLEEGDVLRTTREQELLEMADSRLKNKYKNIVNLENDFEQYEQGINNKTNLENKVKAALPVYQNDVATVLGSLRSFEVPVNDTQNPANNVMVKLEFSDDDLREVQAALTTPDAIVRQVKNGYTVDQLKEEVELVLIKKHFNRLVSKAAKDYNSVQKDKYIKGLKGLLPEKNLDIADDNLGNGNEAIYQELIDSAQN